MKPIFLWIDEKAQGPFTLGQLRSMWDSGKINMKTLYCHEGDATWFPLSDSLELVEPPVAASAPSVAPIYIQQPQTPIKVTIGFWRGVGMVLLIIIVVIVVLEKLVAYINGGK